MAQYRVGALRSENLVRRSLARKFFLKHYMRRFTSPSFATKASKSESNYPPLPSLGITPTTALASDVTDVPSTSIQPLLFPRSSLDSESQTLLDTGASQTTSHAKRFGKYHCVWCGSRFAWYRSLKVHLEFYGEKPHRTEDRRLSLSARDLNDVSVFRNVKRADFLTRTVSLEAYDEVQRDKEFVGTYSCSDYDGPLVAPDRRDSEYAHWPKTIYFELQSTEDGGVVFPSRRYPKDVDAGAPVKVAKVPLRVAESDVYRMYHVQTSPTAYGPNTWSRIHTNVVFAKEDRWQWLEERGAISMDKRKNAILFVRDSDDGPRWFMSTRFNGEKFGKHARGDRPLSINIIFLDALPVEPSWPWFDGVKMKLDHGSGRLRFCCSFCSQKSTSLERFKRHYLQYHSGVDPLLYKDHICDICGYATYRHDYLRQHLNRTHLKNPARG